MIFSAISIAMFLFGEVASKLTSPTFSFRDHCIGEHMYGKYAAYCDGSRLPSEKQVLFLDERSTSGVTDISLFSFEEVLLDSSVMVPNVSIRNTSKVSLVITGKVKNLKIESVEELTLTRAKPHLGNFPVVEEMDAMIMIKIKKLQLDHEGEFLWPVKTVSLSKVDDIVFGSSPWTISSKNVTISGCKISLKDGSSLTLTADSVRILDQSVLYIRDRGSLNVSSDTFVIQDSEIDSEDGNILISPVKTKSVIFHKNLFYNFNKTTVIVSNKKSITFKFVENDMFLGDPLGFMSLQKHYISFVDNKYDCSNCSNIKSLLEQDIGVEGDSNYCYVDCKLSLNHLKKNLVTHQLCEGAEPKIDLSALCLLQEFPAENVSSNSVQYLWWILFSVFCIVAVALVVPYFYFTRCRRNKNTFHFVGAKKEIPQELKQVDHAAFSNDSYSMACPVNDHTYAIVDAC